VRRALALSVTEGRALARLYPWAGDGAPICGHEFTVGRFLYTCTRAPHDPDFSHVAHLPDRTAGAVQCMDPAGLIRQARAVVRS
jgi:hypothetical protein